MRTRLQGRLLLILVTIVTPLSLAAQGPGPSRVGIGAPLSPLTATALIAPARPLAGASADDHRTAGAIIGAGVFVASLLVVLHAADQGEAHSPERPLLLVGVGALCVGAGALIGALFPKAP